MENSGGKRLWMLSSSTSSGSVGCAVMVPLVWQMYMVEFFPPPVMVGVFLPAVFLTRGIS